MSEPVSASRPYENSEPQALRQPVAESEPEKDR